MATQSSRKKMWPMMLILGTCLLCSKYSKTRFKSISIPTLLAVTYATYSSTAKINKILLGGIRASQHTYKNCAKTLSNEFANFSCIAQERLSGFMHASIVSNKKNISQVLGVTTVVIFHHDAAEKVSVQKRQKWHLLWWCRLWTKVWSGICVRSVPTQRASQKVETSPTE